MLSFKEKLAKNYINARGWRTNQKYLIIESDDWGTIRMPSKEVYEILLNNNVEVDKFSFDKHDSLESSEDLSCLFDVLESVKDSKGKPAVLTAYHVMANPNFEAIEAKDKKEYIYETILDTYARNPHTAQSFEWIKQGINRGIYMPQFHGREHIHVKRWMEAINSESEKEQLTYNKKAILWSGSPKDSNPYKKDYFKGFDYESQEEANEVEKVHQDGLRLFKEIFGLNSISFQPQGSVCGNHILRMLDHEGVSLVSGQQLHPDGYGNYKKIEKFWGSKNQQNQLHWRRNSLFEPVENQNFDWVSKCMEEIEIAFRWGKPAVISSHRVNFIGSIFEENRTKSLKKLKILLKKVVKKWPDVQFISTAQLAEIILNQNK